MLIKELLSLRIHLGSKDSFNLMFNDLNKLRADPAVHLQLKSQVSV